MHGASALASAALTEAEEIRQDEVRLRAVATEWLADPTAASADGGHDGTSALASMAELAARLEQRGKCRHGVSRFCASVRVDEKSRTRLDATLGSLYPAYFRKVLAPTDDGAVLDTYRSKVIPPLSSSRIMHHERPHWSRSTRFVPGPHHCNYQVYMLIEGAEAAAAAAATPLTPPTPVRGSQPACLCCRFALTPNEAAASFDLELQLQQVRHNRS